MNTIQKLTLTILCFVVWNTATALALSRIDSSDAVGFALSFTWIALFIGSVLISILTCVKVIDEGMTK